MKTSKEITVASEFNIFADEDEVLSSGQAEEDGLEGGAAVKFVTPVYFTGVEGKNPYCALKVNAKTGIQTAEPVSPKRYAKGHHYDLTESTDQFDEVARKIALDGLGEIVLVRHEGEGDKPDTYKRYLYITNPRYHILSHSAPYSNSQLNYDTTKNVWIYNESATKGVATGIWTRPDKDKGKQNTGSFYWVLAVELTLWNSGYTESDGTPIPVRINFKNQNSSVFSRILSTHASQVRKYRAVYAKQQMEEAEKEGHPISKEKADLRAMRFVTLSSLALDMGPSKEATKHKGALGTTEVYEPFNYTDYDNPYLLDKENYMRFIAPFIFDIAGKKPGRSPEIGGLAVEWSRTQQAAAFENQKHWNPQNKNPFGTTDAPKWMFNAWAGAAHGELEEDESDVPASMRSGKALSQNALRIKGMLQSATNNNEWLLEHDNVEGPEAYENMMAAIDQTEEESEKLALAKDLMKQLADIRSKIAPTEEDPF
jgi:hypothetical protein